ncbi:hypothetical protein AAG906_038421 [Vitis piasezkii]
MDFIIGLSKLEDYGSIIVVVDRFSKYATFIAAPTDCITEELPRLLFKSEATNKSSFELAMRQQPLTPHTLVMGYTGRILAAFKFAKGWHEYEEPFPILGKVSKVSYKVELPPRLKIHPTTPIVVVTFYDKEVEYIIVDRYLVKWKRLPESEAS